MYNAAQYLIGRITNSPKFKRFGAKSCTVLRDKHLQFIEFFSPAHGAQQSIRVIRLTITCTIIRHFN